VIRDCIAWPGEFHASLVCSVRGRRRWVAIWVLGRQAWRRRVKRVDIIRFDSNQRHNKSVMYTFCTVPDAND